MWNPELIAALEPLRRYREANAERAWAHCARRLREQDRQVDAAVAALSTVRQAVEGERRALREAHLGRALSVNDVQAWNQEEQRLVQRVQDCVSAVKEARQVREDGASQLAQARQLLRNRQRSLEKLKALQDWLAEERQP